MKAPCIRPVGENWSVRNLPKRDELLFLSGGREGVQGGGRRRGTGSAAGGGGADTRRMSFRAAWCISPPLSLRPSRRAASAACVWGRAAASPDRLCAAKALHDGVRLEDALMQVRARAAHLGEVLEEDLCGLRLAGARLAGDDDRLRRGARGEAPLPSRAGRVRDGAVTPRSLTWLVDVRSMPECAEEATAYTCGGSSTCSGIRGSQSASGPTDLPLGQPPRTCGASDAL